MSILITSCDTAEKKAERDILVNVVQKYNSLLRLAYLEANLDYMNSIATEDQVGRLFPTFQLLLFEDDYMRAEQKSFEVERARLVSKGKGQVDTTEKWVFWWQDHQTNEITKPPTEVTYHMRYDLVLEDGTWKVDRLEDLDEKK